MNLTVIQPQYPSAETPDGVDASFSWMQVQLDKLQIGEQDIILLSEFANAPGITDQTAMQQCAENQGAGFLQNVAASAQRLNCLIATGAVIRDGDQWFNRTLIFDASGEVVFHYDKIHLPTTESRDLGLTAGSTSPIFEYQDIRIGFATCFDLYFPEHFVALAKQQADLVLCPSYQRSESAERIRLIAQMRAIDTGAYLARSSYAMPTPDHGGHSLIVAPDGTLLANAGNTAGIISAEFDPHQKFTKPASHGQPVVEHRALIESHRRPETYRR
jgi:predicted amidohydrolase